MTHIHGIQDVINVGATPNDGTGDPLRDAMVKVNDNFNDLFSNAVVNTNLTVGNNSVNTFINATSITIVSNGASVRVGNSTVNTVINSTSISLNNNSIISVGNSTVNVSVNSTAVVVGSNAASNVGHTTLPNELKMNWGWISANSTDGNATFSSAFSTAVYVVTATSNATETYAAAVIGSNTTTALIRTANGTSTNVYYMAIGK